ncbi:predicted protein [Uncinocarpus reesii 1704]|uniref:Uncharacterized protein n=1 Tax=Uncinocarpus reesii (strain UAMH 1704) TaxID=336963 RepID=C4JWP7_UNCRE|nr:uncharacterized protein UREG_06989 [Uncinocarpus reesii 1704]EEP82124.1 predicted protein [Uncinocarpus reesii 1704]
MVISPQPNDSEVSGTNPSIAKNYQDMLFHMGFPSRSNKADIDLRISLLDILPEYMSLSGLIPSELQDRWMENAIHLMLHTALEQVFLYGQSSHYKLDEIFAWDWPYEHSQSETSRRMGNYTWSTLRDGTKRSLLASGTFICEKHLRRVSFEHPLFDFEGRVLQLLNDLLAMLQTPILEQLESGNLSEISGIQTQDW